MSNITIPTFSEDVNAHQNLDDQPSLSADELKEAWDKPSNDIKNFLNQTLKPVLESMASAINGLDDTIDDLISSKLQDRYHVGAVIIDYTNTNPATYLGFGTWELCAVGKMFVGVNTSDTDFNTSGKTGGTKTVTLTTNQIPAHKHTLTDPGHAHGVTDPRTLS